jgi:hypothetical protein
MEIDHVQISLHTAGSNNLEPQDIHMKYELVVCQQGPSSLTGILTAVVIRLFEVKNLEMIVSDSQGNTEKVNWEKGDIAVLAGGCNVDLSGNGKLVCVFLTRNMGFYIWSGAIISKHRF